MIGYSKYRFNIWKQKVFLFPPNAMTYIYKFYLTCEKHSTTNKRSVSAGVKVGECGINCDAAPTGNRGSELIAGSYTDDLVISTVARSVINFNSYARCYV
jgi:hypothetical protein